ncbi:hypothetical protein KKD52_07070 [Myxococcota bacterium]|nr:hypothetical protein [Myxococcota bacterium]MBU1412406.1 hypothetical protein [Myxococcota bacterium]MBU1510106.1 hypothetical protein [Myxococcota bacterium]
MRFIVMSLLLAWLSTVGCAEVPRYSAKTLHARPSGMTLPQGASIAVLATGDGATPVKGARNPGAVSERVIRVLRHRGYRVMRITEAALSTCDADYILRLHALDYEKALVQTYSLPTARKYAVTADVFDGRTRRHLGRTRFLLRHVGFTNDGPTAEDRAVSRTLSWLGQRGTLEPWRPELPRNGAFFMGTLNATALFTRKTVNEEIPYYRPGPDLGRISLQSLVFGVSFIFAPAPLELTLGCSVSGLLGSADVDGAGPYLGLEYTFASRRSLKTTFWVHGQAGLLSRGEVAGGHLLQAALGAGLSWSPWRVLRLYARAGLGAQSLGTEDLDVTWSRPRSVTYDSFIVVLDAGFSLNW